MANQLNTSKNAIKDAQEFIGNLGDFTLDRVYELTNKNDTRIRKLNLPLLIDQLVKAIFKFEDNDFLKNNQGYTAEEKILISAFMSDFETTVAHFMDFLDYDGDNQVKLVKFEKEKGTIQIGKDIDEFLKDAKDIGSSIKTDAPPQEKVFLVLSKIFLFLISERYNESKEDMNNFIASIKVSLKSLKALKNINHKKVFDSKIDDMVSFIIMFCVILIPIIDLVDHKLSELNKSDNDENEGIEKQIMITNEDITNAIKETYGDRLEYVIELVKKLTEQMLKIVNSSGWKKLFCCISSESD